MLLSAVSFIPIALLSPEFFELEGIESMGDKLAILVVVMSRFRDQNVIGFEKKYFPRN